MTEISNLIKDYYTWLKDKTVWQQLDDWVEITVPFLDRYNDHLQIYLKKATDGFLLTDDGETIDGLIQEGCSIESQKHMALLEITLNGYGVKRVDNQLQVEATSDDFSFRKHSLVQAMLAVNDMFYLAEPHVTSFFLEDVQNWLDTSGIRYTEQISFTGRSKYIRKFDFVIPKSEKAPERIIKTINKPEKSSVDNMIIAWSDTRDIRPDNSKAYAFLNDNEDEIASGVLTALKAYDIEPVQWKQRNEIKGTLAA